MQRFELRTDVREQMLDITPGIAEAIRSSGVREGMALVFCPHTTAGITINENADPDVVEDLLDGLRRIVPREAGWTHAEGNSGGHLKAALVGSAVTVPVSGAMPVLGTWQGVYFCEFDGPRSRSVVVKVIGE